MAVVEVVRVFNKQTVEGCGGPFQACSWNGEAECAVLSNELEWSKEAGPFHKSQGGQSVKTSPASLRSQGLNAAF